MKSWIVLVIIFVVYSTVHASKDSKKIKLKSAVKKLGKPHNDKRIHENVLGGSSSRTAENDASKSIKKKDSNGYNSKKDGNFSIKLKQGKQGSLNDRFKKLNLKSKLATKKSSLSSGKRQNVFTEDPSQQRLFHIDETGTLHRHEVGPEEYTTPEGKTATFSNDRLLTGGNFVNLRPSQAAVVDASTRQMTTPALSPPNEISSSSLPEIQPGSPVAFAVPPPMPPSPPRRYYLMTYHRPSDPTSRDQVMYWQTFLKEHIIVG
jgi:hypothetical protein